MSSNVEINESLDASLHASSVSIPNCDASHRALSMRFLPMSALATSFMPCPDGVT